MSFRTRIFNRIRRAFGANRRPSMYSPRLTGGRLLGDMPATYSSPDSFLRGGLREWRAKARWQASTNPYAKQIVRVLETNLIGPRGIQMRGNVLLDPEEANLAPGQPRETAKDGERNRLIEEAWQEFCRADSFDISGVRSFHQFELGIAGSFPATGGALVRVVREAAGMSKVPLSFELISCEQLDEQYTQVSDIPGRHWRMGIEYDDRTGRRTRYAILTRHPGDSEFSTGKHLRYEKHFFIPAAEILHIFIPEEIGQTRERPWLLSVLTTIQNVQEYEQSHWTRKRVTNNTLGFIQKPEPDAPGLMDSTSGLASETDESTGEIISRSTPGQWIELLPGETPIPPQFGPDDQMYPQVLKTMMRRMASGGGISYQQLSKDFSDTNYSSSRMSELQDRDYWRCLQSQLIAMFHQKVFELWFEAAMVSGELPMELFSDYYEQPKKYCRPTWIPRSWAAIDPKKEMDAYATARNLGLQSASYQIAELYGSDLEAVWAQLAYEKQLAEDLDLDLATYAPGQIPNDGMPDTDSEEVEEAQPVEPEAEED